ncbi:hypothetical protein ACQEVZ_25900 [Dactylosporangium sp. CA-152071]|uniref:hypothetical protein n=1 Tax=Dactylosporangium sp. CA-152071 TaxID=3239933 RepID=UPI003D8A5563
MGGMLAGGALVGGTFAGGTDTCARAANDAGGIFPRFGAAGTAPAGCPASGPAALGAVDAGVPYVAGGAEVGAP